MRVNALLCTKNDWTKGTAFSPPDPQIVLGPSYPVVYFYPVIRNNGFCKTPTQQTQMAPQNPADSVPIKTHVHLSSSHWIYKDCVTDLNSAKQLCWAHVRRKRIWITPPWPEFCWENSDKLFSYFFKGTEWINAYSQYFSRKRCLHSQNRQADIQPDTISPFSLK